MLYTWNLNNIFFAKFKLFIVLGYSQLATLWLVQVNGKGTQPYVSVQFSRSVVSDCLWPHGLQHTRLPCPSPTPGACSNSCLSSWWCHPTISSIALRIHISILPQNPIPSRLVHDIEQSSLCYTLSPCWFCIWNMAVCTWLSQTPLLSLPLATISSFSKSMSLFLFCKSIHWYHFGFHI